MRCIITNWSPAKACTVDQCNVINRRACKDMTQTHTRLSRCRGRKLNIQDCRVWLTTTLNWFHWKQAVTTTCRPGSFWTRHSRPGTTCCSTPCSGRFSRETSGWEEVPASTLVREKIHTCKLEIKHHTFQIHLDEKLWFLTNLHRTLSSIILSPTVRYILKRWQKTHFFVSL